jgi:ectoine hydroxylase-related dioxygenase (phytanoyl-CoA dioxygenase family)
MRIWHDQTLIKAPWGMPTAIHIDNPNWSYTSAGALSLWVALDDVSERNGCAWT